MEYFDVVAQARAGLDEEDRAWFSENLEKELRQLGNLTRYKAVLIGDGARVVVKDGVLVEGTVRGDVVNIAGGSRLDSAPETDEETPERKPTHDHLKRTRLPLGVVEFEKIITRNYFYIDKTRLIREILEEGEIILITRPRRFGKTLNQDMLRCFFEKSETDKRR
ncbi:MAG: AAA family ATPase, partial [Desulfobacterales bacterium]|nr:AAA family ATPase [Desulfobacterales bacterium]